MRSLRFVFNIGALLTVMSVPLLSYGQGTDDVRWTVSADPEVVKAGESVMIRFTVEIGGGWNLYAMDSPGGRPLEIEINPPGEGLTHTGLFTQSEPDTKYDPNFEMDVRSYDGLAEFETEVEVAEDFVGELGKVTGDIIYMYCNESVCIPSDNGFEVDFEVTPKPEIVVATVAEGVKEVEMVEEDGGVKQVEIVEKVEGETEIIDEKSARVDRFDRPMVAVEKPQSEATISSAKNGPGAGVPIKSRGLFAFMLLAAGAGFAALLTPCVFPMIPLTISFFSKQGGNRSRAIRMSLVFGLSIIVIFTLLGVLMALLVGAAGAQTIAANPWVNLFIGLVFIIFALSLLGMFELRLPNSLLNYFNKQGNENSGMLGVLFMGTTLTLVSFSCTAPFVGGLLATAAGKEFIWPIFGMIAFSAAFSLPFIFFAMFPNWLESLPKSGSWMNVVKVSLGFVELAAAWKFLSNADLVWQWGLISRPLVIAIWIVIFAVAGFYLMGKIKIGYDELEGKLGTGRMLTGMSFLALALYLIPGLLGGPLNSLDAYLPPRQATDIGLAGMAFGGSSSDNNEYGLAWSTNDKQPYQQAIAEAFASAKSQDKYIFVDFTGYTCTNCRQMESTVFRQAAVADRLTNNFSLLQLYTDHPEDGRPLQKYQLELTGTVALPTYAILTPEGELRHLWAGMASVDEFTEFLDRPIPASALTAK